ncbi:putative late blight resistance protein homolog R1A-3 [Solanum lycopersicum]|uniref:putative late blight resistance protein homolog R1A-3 n=1 Tax=Solanum lycopersicum TaxID=4081 RepID=UPI0002BCB8D0|nr:putative late blight resistance protein homolog R1A-3 [Solanum lycopersicum]
MAQNEIEEMLDRLRRIESRGNLSSVEIGKVEKFERMLRFLRTITSYHRFIFPDTLVKLTKKAKSIVKTLQGIFDGIPDECKTNLNLERLVSHLFEFFQGNTTSLSCNSESNDFDLSECMDWLVKNINDVLILVGQPMDDSSCRSRLEFLFIKQLKIIHKKMRFLRYLYATEINGYIDYEKLEGLETRIQVLADNVGQLCTVFIVLEDEDEDEDDNEIVDIVENKPPYLLGLIVLVEQEMKKIFLSELKASKFTQSKTFKDKKLPKGFSHHLNSLLVYLRNTKLKNFPDNVSAQNIGLSIELLLFFLDADLSNHVISRNWLNEILENVATIAGDVLYVIQKLLPRSISKDDDTSKINIYSMQVLEKTKDLKAQVETYYKSLIFTPSQFPTSGGLTFMDSLLRKLNEMSRSKYGLDLLMKPIYCNLEKEQSTLISNLEKELSSLSSIFRDVTKVHHEHKDLQRRTINLAYEAGVSIDSICAKYNVFWHCFCSLPTIVEEIKQINAEVTEMWSADIPLNPHYVAAPFKHLPTRHSNPITDEEIVGFGIDKEKIIQCLIRGTNDLDVVPIVGMGGQGKTTIARKVYNSDNIVSHFDVRAWCIVSQTYNRRKLLQEILSQVTGSKDKGYEDDILADELRKSLMGKRYLIVLDDMWDCMAWDDLRLSFPDFGNRSRIVVTTRLEKVGEQVKFHTDPYSLPFLTKEESCKLLQKKVFQKEDCPPELQDVSQVVAEKCKGLPLVIVLVAGIIKTRKLEESWWNEVKDSLFDYLDCHSEQYSRATMQLSFDNLADCLKPCLLYMGMFPEDASINVSALLSLWLAEDFVQNIKSAEDYLMNLISSNVVMVSKKEYNGKIKYCEVHDVVLHFCLEKSREENFMLVAKGNHSQFQSFVWKQSRVSFNLIEENSKFASKTRKCSHQPLRSLITNGASFYIMSLSSWIHNLRLLKVLVLSSYEVDYVNSATLKPLNYLKYLGVRATTFYFDRESHLPHLETLIVKNDRSVMLRGCFWEMEQLRHVEINDAEFDKQGLFEGSSKLENLRILKNIVGFPIDRADVLSRRCPNLQQLQIEFGSFAEPLWLTLENLTQLQILDLSFRLFHMLSGLQLPSNLKMLVLRDADLENLTSFFAGLPSLEYLQLTNMYFPQSEWCLGDITFHKLKLLKLVQLDISRWDVSEESFPLLETIVIRWCHNLEEIPISFADVPTLKQIKLVHCKNKSLEDSAVRIKKDVEENEGNDRIDLIIKK